MRRTLPPNASATAAAELVETARNQLAAADEKRMDHHPPTGARMGLSVAPHGACDRPPTPLLIACCAPSPPLYQYSFTYNALRLPSAGLNGGFGNNTERLRRPPHNTRTNGTHKNACRAGNRVSPVTREGGQTD